MGVGTPVPSDFDVTPGNNSTIDGTNAAEGCAAAGINNICRSLAASIARAWGGMYSGSTRPTAVQSGSLWRDTSGGATANVIKYYDGSDDISIVTINTTANTSSFSLADEASDIDIPGLTDVSTLEAADSLVVQDDSAGARREVTVQNLFDAINDALTAETTPATDDLLAIYDTSDSATDKMTFANFLKVINALTEKTDLTATTDFLPVYDASGTAAKKVSKANVNAPDYVDGTGQTPTAGSTLSFAHGMAAIPGRVEVWMVNQSADRSYSPGDVVYITPWTDSHGGFNIAVDTTNVKIVIGTNGIGLLDASANTVASISAAKWKLYVKAWYK